MAYDIDNPPSLVTQGIGGPAGLRWFALYWNDPIADVLVPGYITNAAEIGLRPGDGLIYKDVNRGEWDHYDLICLDVAADGSGTLAFPEVPEEALPFVSEIDPDGTSFAVLYHNGRQVRSSLDQAAAVILAGAEQSFPASEDYASPSIDASTYLQNLFNAAAASVGKTRRAAVQINSSFRIDEMLVLPDNVDIVAGKDGALDVSNVPMLTALVAIGTNGSKVCGLTITGSGQGSQPANHPGPVSLSDFRLAGCGIVFAGVTNGLIEHCKVENCGGTSGILPNNGVAGIWLTYGCTYTTVQHNDVSTCRNGINEDNFFQVDPKHNKILYNKVVGCRFGIALDSAANATDTLVQGNSVESCLQSGIDLNKANRARVTHNYVFGCGIESGNSGIFAYGTGSIPLLFNDISHNFCVSNLGHGIKLGPYAYYNGVKSNKCINNIKNGILVQGIARINAIDDNLCIGNTLAGINIFRPLDDGTAVITTNSIQGNRLFQNVQEGLYVGSGSELLIGGNIIKGNSQASPGVYDGLELNQGTTNCRISDNTITGTEHRYAVVGVDSATQNNIFSDNQILGGTLGRFGFANFNQRWDGNGDDYLTVAGAPAGAWPFDFLGRNNGDGCWYWRRSDGTWTVIYTQTGTATRGDESVTLAANSKPNQRFNSALTANRMVNLPATGRDYTISRTAIAGGAFSLSIMSGAAVVQVLAAGQWAEVSYDEGTAAWVVSKSGTLI